MSSNRPLVSQAGRFGFAATDVLVGPSLEGGRSDSPLDGGLEAALVFLAPGPILLDNPAPEATRLLGLAMGRAGARVGPTVLANGFLVVRAGRAEELTLRVIVPGTGLAAGFLGAAALSARVILLVAGGFKPVSWSLRLAPPTAPGWVVRRVTLNNGGATSCEVVNGSSGIEAGGGPRIDGLLIIGETSGEVVWGMLGDFSANGTLDGEGSFDG